MQQIFRAMFSWKEHSILCNNDFSEKGLTLVIYYFWLSIRELKNAIMFCTKCHNFLHVVLAEADLGLLQHPRWSALLHLRCCSSPRSAYAWILEDVARLPIISALDFIMNNNLLDCATYTLQVFWHFLYQ